MARVGVENPLERLLGVSGMRVQGARFEPRGVVVEVQPPLLALRLLPAVSVASPDAGAHCLLVELRSAPRGVP